MVGLLYDDIIIKTKFVHSGGHRFKFPTPYIISFAHGVLLFRDDSSLTSLSIHHFPLGPIHHYRPEMGPP